MATVEYVLFLVLVVVVIAVEFATLGAQRADGASLEEPEPPGFMTLIEARLCTPFVPDPKLVIGGGVSGSLFTAPGSWWLIGGRTVFADGIYLRGQTALGASIMRRNWRKDDGVRAWVAGWKEGDCEWSAGIAYGKEWDW